MRVCIACVGLPVFAAARAGIVANAVSLPLVLAPLKPKLRLACMAAMLLAGFAVFHTSRVQQKMFYSGHGDLTDLRWDNPDLETSGRAHIWAALAESIPEAPWFGHGANASESYVIALTGGIAHPHNDWLRIAYDYGLLGTALLLVTLIAQIRHTLGIARQSTGPIRLCAYAAASTFIPFAFYMLTDNILLYAAFFGNLQFALLGLTYSAYSQRTQTATRRGRLFPPAIGSLRPDPRSVRSCTARASTIPTSTALVDHPPRGQR